VGETVFRALLDAAGPTGSINVAFRIFPEHVEVDVLHSDTLLPEITAQQRGDGQAGAGQAQAAASPARPGDGSPGRSAVARSGAGQAGLDQAGLDRAAFGTAALDTAGEAATSPSSTERLGGPGQPATFAEWMSVALRREGLTQEAAARQLGVSVKTVSRWVGGTTEPRMRDLRRIQEVFGTLPLP
ncbi:MAG: helix-turn-helix domain-containing protein, partial [Streptosporangiaceae bacterium]